ncbi:unnamed protein product [Heligmosomoides polygyrus]|uniref:Uncharacterized protein n=1 Tax=Heligmosomoides polygyrus TaxID=6339 RepID=A0A183FMS7_HELPZ|nr:unnamed protein product [Heligmosomoides polygyrus]
MVAQWLEYNMINNNIIIILAREIDIAARKTLEALWIAFKNPTINRREERVALTHELAPFADLCGLDPGERQPEGC